MRWYQFYNDNTNCQPCSINSQSFYLPFSLRNNILSMVIQNIHNAFLWFTNFTSIPGFAQARTSNNKYSKCAWSILFIIGAVLTIRGLQASISSYLEHRSVTTITNEFVSMLKFPSVTICNLNRVHCGHLYDMISRCEKVFLK